MASIPSILRVIERGDGSKYWHYFSTPTVHLVAETSTKSVNYRGFYIRNNQTLTRYAVAAHSGNWRRERTITWTCYDEEDEPEEVQWQYYQDYTLSGQQRLEDPEGGDWTIIDDVTITTDMQTQYDCEEGAPVQSGGTSAVSQPSGFAISDGASTNPPDPAYSVDATSVTRGNPFYPTGIYSISGSGPRVTLNSPISVDGLFEAQTPTVSRSSNAHTIYTIRTDSTDVTRAAFPLTRKSCNYAFLCLDLNPGKKYVVRGKILRKIAVLDVAPGEWEDVSTISESFTAAGSWHVVGGSYSGPETPTSTDVNPETELDFEGGWEYQVANISIEAASPIQ
ncbi:MAG: hypothetical protein ACQKBU_07345 [Verrucomicrobiales bacterium]